MCEKCFSSEINGFENYKAEDRFTDTLYKLVADEVLEIILPTQTNPDDSLYSATVDYRCKFCDERWSYSSSEKAWRGFFLRSKNVEHKMLADKRKESHIRTGCLLFIILILVIVYYFSQK